jgi:hypothetical protein
VNFTFRICGKFGLPSLRIRFSPGQTFSSFPSRGGRGLQDLGKPTKLAHSRRRREALDEADHYLLEVDDAQVRCEVAAEDWIAHPDRDAPGRLDAGDGRPVGELPRSSQLEHLGLQSPGLLPVS